MRGRTLLPLLLAACSSGNDYPDCGEPAAISVANADVVDEDGSLALPAGVETDLALQVTDAEGDLCDPSDVRLSFDDAEQIDVVSSGEATVLRPRHDAIDLGAEPTTMLHTSLGGLRASWPVVSVVALGGAWTVTVTERTRYPDGYEFGEVVFAQHGRHLVWEDCSIPIVCSQDAVIRGADFTVDAPDVGLTLSAPIDSDRNGFAGPWSAKDGMYEGDFIAERIE